LKINYTYSLFNLEGKNAVISGGSQGIGRGIALSLANFGANITVIGRNKHLLEETIELTKEIGGNCEAYIVDVGDRTAINEFFTEYIGKHNSLDIYVNNAGFTVHAELQDTSFSDIDRLIDTNLKGAIHCLKNVANIMKGQRMGVITIITSINALNSHPGQGMYSVTKYALEGTMKSLASVLAKYGVRVNSCAPGAIDTAMNTEAFSDPRIHDTILNKIPLNRIGTIQDIGDVVACISSDAFRYMTGATVVVDGGMMLKQK